MTMDNLGLWTKCDFFSKKINKIIFSKYLYLNLLFDKIKLQKLSLS